MTDTVTEMPPVATEPLLSVEDLYVTFHRGSAAVQAVAGIILLILSLTERPKGIASLALGAVVTLGGVGVGVLAFLWGGA